jgi:predicted molibdopterin-dependent oxidoreductase YjgC
MIELRVDGRAVEVEEGVSVLDAARKAGVYVPTLCHQRDLSPFGGCRMCTVEIEGVRGFPTSCTTPAQPGMVVRTDTEKVRELRKGVLELLLSEHPSSCLVCDDRMACWDTHECTGRAEITTGCKFCPNNGRCELQDVMQYVTGEEGLAVTLEQRYRAIPVDRRDPFIDRDDNLCILCGRCVRACAEQSLSHTLDFMHRGGEARVGTAFKRTLVESGCRFCGACVDACPTGTLSERVRRWEGPAQQSVPTTCSLCSVGCQFDLGTKNDRVIEALPRMDGVTGEREACVRGRFAVVELVRSVRRLKTPLLRRDGALVEVPWEAALEAAAAGIRSCDAQRSALVYSGSCTNEDVYVAHKFARDVLGTPHVDSSLRLSYGPLLGANGARVSLARISELAEAEAVLIVGADPDFSHPVLARTLERAALAGRTRLVLIGPHATGLSAHAACEIRHAPGEERQVLEWLEKRLSGGTGGEPREDVERAAEILEAATSRGSALVVYGTGPMRRLDASANQELVEGVAKALSAKVLPLLSRANDRGALEIARAFACQGLSAAEILGAPQSGQLDLLYLIGEDVWPGGHDAKFVVVQDMFLPAEAGEIADVVLPVASFAEIDGSYTNLEGRVRRLRQAIRPLGVSKPDWEILSRLAKQLGAEGFEYREPSDVMAELAGEVPFFRGASYTALEKQKPFFGRSKAGRRAGAAAPVAARRAPRSETPSADYPFSLLVEFDEYAHRATPLSAQVRGLGRIEPAARAALNIADAEALGIETGAPVRVISRRGRATAQALLSERVQPGVIRMVGRGGNGSPVGLLDLLLDPASKAPEELCAVRIERL